MQHIADIHNERAGRDEEAVALWVEAGENATSSSASQEAVRHCNALAGDAASPDLVAFMGFEWTQFGRTPDTHYGHHNVLFRDIEQEQLPARAIGAAGPASDQGEFELRVKMPGRVEGRQVELPAGERAARQRFNFFVTGFA